MARPRDLSPLSAALGMLVSLGLMAPAPALAERLSPDARARLRSALAVKQRHAPALLSRADVVGIGAGVDADGRAVIRVLTARPLPGLPATLDGVAVRERVTGRLHALRGATCEASGDAVCDPDERWPLPVPTGVSVGHPSISAGTIAARVTDGVDVLALSNNHVLAASNQALIGDAVIQPGSFDGGSLAAGDEIGTLFDFEPIVFCDLIFGLPLCSQPNFIDAAVALSSPGQLGFATPTGEHGSEAGYGAPSPILHAAYGDPSLLGDEDLGQLQNLAVQKYGRTTGQTTGVIDTIGLSSLVCYDELCTLIAQFDDQLAITGPFSGPGDSGSLVVTDDAAAQPVGLLFAGSETQSILSRIDLVLDRFGVTIDDGGTTGPVVDASVESFGAPSYAIVDETTPVAVEVRNRGTEPLASFDVVFRDETELTESTLTAPALAPGATAQLDFDWTPTATGPHTVSVELQLADDDPGNDTADAQVPVLLEPPGISLRVWRGAVRTDLWTLVDLGVDYGSEMVVVCTPLYDATAIGPLVARVRNAAGTSFEVGLGRPWFGAFPGEEGAADVHCMALRAGVYTEADSGVRLEAVRIAGLATKDDTTSWVGSSRSYAQAYAQPVVVGQVISPATGGLPGELGVWSVFWARGPTSFDPPSAAQLFVGRHTAEDPTARAPEDLAYVVIEAGRGRIGQRPYRAALGAETVRGVDDAPPHVYGLDPPFGPARTALASSAGMDGLEGGWPVLWGAGAVAPDGLGLAIEEDWWFDPERSHTTEQVGYLILGPRTACGLGVELALALPLWARLRRLRGRSPLQAPTGRAP
ncbi:MAG: CARDB domain-containing protein [Myxococcota bacterium]|nr:CARDB domain-containing protein [Myxococcota bacterium]